MSDQLELLLHSRNTDPSTSHRAAAAVDINRKCREVLGVLWSHRHSSPCFTDGDLASWCQEDRLDGRGRMAKLWTISEYGYAVAAEVLAA